jgi:membrane-associated phospholipid phosphatase
MSFGNRLAKVVARRPRSRGPLLWLSAPLILLALCGSAGAAEPPAPATEHRLVWRYPRFRAWELVAAGVVTVGNVGAELVYRHQPGNHWTRPILLDAPARSFFRGGTASSRDQAASISDYLWYGGTYYVLADGLLTPLITDKLNTDVALQLTLLNWQAIGTAGLLARIAHDTVGRTRPSLQGCTNEPGSDNPCEFRGASFVAGHAMMSSANAGLACADHQALKLYGGGIPDAVVCPVMVTTAAGIGVLRMIADRHWLSDTIAGWLVGGSLGYGLPYFLHFRYVRQIAAPLPHSALIPWGDATSGGVRFLGYF